MTASIDIAPEVRAHLSGGGLAWIRNLRETRRCGVCGLSVQVGIEHAVVLFDIYLDESWISFAHSTCATSQVRYIGTETPEADDDVSVVAMLHPHANGTRAVLLFASHAKRSSLSASGDLLDVGTMGLLSSGWTILPTVGKSPELLPDWKVTLDLYSGRGEIISAEGISFLDDLPASLPPGWIEILAMTKELTILSGAIDIDAIIAAQKPLKVLNDYGHRGILIGARVPVEFGEIPTDPLQAAGRGLSRDLRQAMEIVAPSEGIGEDALVPLEVAVEFKPVRSGNGKPMLLVDLCDDDDDHVRNVLDELKALGFPTGTAPDIKRYFLPNAPKGWGCIVWPSQIRIFINRTSIASRQLWFTRFSYTDMQWFHDVRQVGAIGLIVGNKFPAEVDLLDLINDMRRGSVLGTGIPAICV
jgi:hypothetical protein